MAPAAKRTQSVGVKDVDQTALVKALAAYLKRSVSKACITSCLVEQFVWLDLYN